MKTIPVWASIMIMLFVAGGITFADSTGADLIWYSNGWYSGEATPTAGILYRAITRDAVRDQTFAVARVDGGVDVHNWGGAWGTDFQVGAPVVYTALDAFKNKQYDYVAARVDGGFDEVFFDFAANVWKTLILPVNGNTHIYNAVATDAINGGGPGSIWEFFAARSGGGMDLFFLTGGSWLLVPLFDPNTAEYVAMASDMNESRKYYAARLGGGIDLVTENTISELPGTRGLQYVSLAADKTIDDRLYGVKPDGSIEIISLSGGSWVIEAVPVTEAFYIAVDTRDPVSPSDPNAIMTDSLYVVKRTLECGDPGTLMSGDLAQDCFVNLVDFEVLANQWAKCSNPADPNCP